MIHLTPFLLFDGNCADAMQFYSSCFGGDLTLTKLADTPMKDQLPREQHHKIVYAHLKSDAVEFSATDWLHPTRKPLQGNTTAIYISGGTVAALRLIFNKLAAGADRNNFVDLENMAFGVYGRLTDQYGVEWFFQA